MVNVETALSRGKIRGFQKYVSKAYSSWLYTGTETVQADKEVNKCLNITTSSTKIGKIYCPTVSSATVAFNAMYATLFAFIVAVAIFNNNGIGKGLQKHILTRNSYFIINPFSQNGIFVAHNSHQAKAPDSIQIVQEDCTCITQYLMCASVK